VLNKRIRPIRSIFGLTGSLASFLIYCIDQRLGNLLALMPRARLQCLTSPLLPGRRLAEQRQVAISSGGSGCDRSGKDLRSSSAGCGERCTASARGECGTGIWVIWILTGFYRCSASEFYRFNNEMVAVYRGLLMRWKGHCQSQNPKSFSILNEIGRLEFAGS
jgi:hypothetical protein